MSRITPEWIFDAVAEVYSLEPDSLKTPSRERPYEEARRVLAHLLYVDAWLSWAGVADQLGLGHVSGSISLSAQRAPTERLAEVRKLYRTAGKAS